MAQLQHLQDVPDFSGSNPGMGVRFYYESKKGCKKFGY